MTNIEKKSLEHTLSVLNSFDPYKTYKSLGEALAHHNVLPESVSRILLWYDEAQSEQTKKVSDAKTWLNALISDIK